MLSFINGKENFNNHRLGALRSILKNKKLNISVVKINLFLSGLDMTEDLNHRYADIRNMVYLLFLPEFFFLYKKRCKNTFASD